MNVIKIFVRLGRPLSLSEWMLVTYWTRYGCGCWCQARRLPADGLLFLGLDIEDLGAFVKSTGQQHRCLWQCASVPPHGMTLLYLHRAVAERHAEPACQLCTIMLPAMMSMA
jgi:hypothetical protein